MLAEGRRLYPRGGGSAKVYSIVIPPPNVTAALHLGHALNNTLQDILVRWRRMGGYNTLWMPGTDHAGIATQTVVEKRILAEEGKRRTDFARDGVRRPRAGLEGRVRGPILGQLKAMGCSCDWSRTRFTMDEVCARAVRAAFFLLFADGLIYRGKRLVNWDPATQTVLADDEVEHETVKGHFWYLRYPLVQPVDSRRADAGVVTVATTRPETMLGDTAVAMNPRDPRARRWSARRAPADRGPRDPHHRRTITSCCRTPASEDAKARYATGFLKVTPAHDPNDYEPSACATSCRGQRHGPRRHDQRRHGWADCERRARPEQFLGHGPLRGPQGHRGVVPPGKPAGRGARLRRTRSATATAATCPSSRTCRTSGTSPSRTPSPRPERGRRAAGHRRARAQPGRPGA